MDGARFVLMTRPLPALAFCGGVARTGASRVIAAALDAVRRAGQAPRLVDARWEPAVGALLGGAQWVHPAPGDLLQRETQRLGVRELAVEQRERHLQRGELRVGERNRGQMEVLRPQRVVLLLGDAVDRALDGQRDAERVEL